MKITNIHHSIQEEYMYCKRVEKFHNSIKFQVYTQNQIITCMMAGTHINIATCELPLSETHYHSTCTLMYHKILSQYFFPIYSNF